MRQFSAPKTALGLVGAALLLLGGSRQCDAQQRGSGYVREVIASTVALEVATASGLKRGTGFFVDTSGTLFTAAHVLAGALSAVVIDSEGLRTPVDGLLYSDSVLDFAALRVTRSSRTFVSFADSDVIEVGTRILVVGSPLGLDFTVADGVISARRTFDGREFLQISAPVSPGSSGGAVVDEAGRVVGLVVSAVRGGGAQNLNFALSARNLRELLPVVRTRAPESLQTSPMGRFGSELDLMPVNEGIRPDWSALDGSEVTSQHARGGGYADKTWVRFRRTRDDSGNPALERSAIMSTVFTDLRESIVSQYQSRTLVRTDSAVGYEHYIADVIVSERRRAESQSSVLHDGLFRRSGTVSSPLSARAPAGVLPPDLAMAVLATIKIPGDSLLLVKTLVADSTGVALRTVRFEVGAPRRAAVPFGNSKTKCSPAGTPHRRTVSVLPVRLTSGAISEEFVVLEEPPRLRASEVICVFVPQKGDR